MVSPDKATIEMKSNPHSKVPQFVTGARKEQNLASEKTSQSFFINFFGSGENEAEENEGLI